jgi:hypothetical protein
LSEAKNMEETIENDGAGVRKGTLRQSFTGSSAEVLIHHRN